MHGTVKPFLAATLVGMAGRRQPSAVLQGLSTHRLALGCVGSVVEAHVPSSCVAPDLDSTGGAFDAGAPLLLSGPLSAPFSGPFSAGGGGAAVPALVLPSFSALASLSRSALASLFSALASLFSALASLSFSALASFSFSA